ncbi:MAG: class I SAM-dependent methyltransferase [Thermoplasmata archaeon]
MTIDHASEQVVDYRDYDFRSVWVGRSGVDRFDRAVLDLALTHLDRRRTLEIGTGFGRLTPQLLHGRGEYVGIDFDLGGLSAANDSMTRAGLPNPHVAWLGANAYHLPFASGSFSSVCMVRVHHHLADPARALREIHRVLVPGGSALITFNGRSWPRSLVHDAAVLLGRPRVANDRRLLFARGGHLEVHETPLRHFITTPSQFALDLRETGFQRIRTYGGAETKTTRFLPHRLGLLCSQVWPGAPVFSDRWVVVRKSGPVTGLRAWDQLLACPRCGAASSWSEETGGPTRPCGRCGFVLRRVDRILDARYVPDDAPGTTELRPGRAGGVGPSPRVPPKDAPRPPPGARLADGPASIDVEAQDRAPRSSDPGRSDGPALSR